MKTLLLALAVVGTASAQVAATAGQESESKAQAPGVAQVAHIKGMDKAPQPLTKVAPVYPKALREKGVQGTAIVEAKVDSMGRVTEVALVRATTPEFGDRALDAAKGWTFAPAEAQGRPITARVRLPFDFTMPQVAAMERK
jgi:TonB family protein